MIGFANNMIAIKGSSITANILFIRKMIKVYELVTAKLPVIHPVSFKVEYLHK
jgi:hypothetical protein